MNQLAERLRSQAGKSGFAGWSRNPLLEAADEIERLERELARYRPPDDEERGVA